MDVSSPSTRVSAIQKVPSSSTHQSKDCPSATATPNSSCKYNCLFEVLNVNWVVQFYSCMLFGGCIIIISNFTLNLSAMYIVHVHVKGCC